MGSYSLRDRAFLQSLQRASRDLEQMKNLQRIGSTNLATHVTNSAMVTSEPYYDPNTGVYIGESIYQTIEFRAANQTSPFGRMGMDLMFGSPSTPASDGDININSYQFRPTEVGDRKLQWLIDLRGPAGTKFYAIFKVAASDYGTISIGSPS